MSSVLTYHFFLNCSLIIWYYYLFHFYICKGNIRNVLVRQPDKSVWLLKPICVLTEATAWTITQSGSLVIENFSLFWLWGYLEYFLLFPYCGALLLFSSLFWVPVTKLISHILANINICPTFFYSVPMLCPWTYAIFHYFT